MKRYDFDEVIDRAGTDSVSRDGFAGFLRESGASALTRPAGEYIRMWVADMEFAPPPEVLEALRARLDRRILGYTMLTDDRFYEAFSGWCAQRYGWRFPAEELVFSPGIVAALYRIAAELTGPGDQIVILTPSYRPFAGAAAHSGAELVCSPLTRTDGRYAIDFDDLGKKLADPRAKLLIFCNPHNPTGRVWTEEELRRVAAMAESNGVWIISDEIHCDLTRTGLVHTPLAMVAPDYPRLVTCMSASKTFNLAGLGLSEIVIRDKTLRRRFTAGVMYEHNPLSLEAHRAAFARGDDWLAALHGYLDGNFARVKEFFDARFPAAAFTIPEATYLAWADLSAYLPAATGAAAFFADRAGVVLEDGASFVANAEGFVRMNVAMPRALLTEALERMGRALESA